MCLLGVGGGVKHTGLSDSSASEPSGWQLSMTHIVIPMISKAPIWQISEPFLEAVPPTQSTPTEKGLEAGRAR